MNFVSDTHSAAALLYARLQGVTHIDNHLSMMLHTAGSRTPEQGTAFRVVLVRYVAYYVTAEHNFGLVDIEARKHIPGVVNATAPYQRVFPLLHVEF